MKCIEDISIRDELKKTISETCNNVTHSMYCGSRMFNSISKIRLIVVGIDNE